jgi:diphosphomevalonate decarboxylase
MNTDPSSLSAIEATVTAPVNIAVIKYWGKRDEHLILPTNSSLSATLSQDVLHSKTSVRADLNLPEKEDWLWLNGKRENVKDSKRLSNVVTTLRNLRAQLEQQQPQLPRICTWPLRIVSENNFPTAAGLASSASGFAALVCGLAAVYDLYHGGQDDQATLSMLSKLARLGSGSACRSLFGGFVAWDMGKEENGTDSQAIPVASETYWPEMESLILVVHDGKKGISSTSGMQTTVQTSSLSRQRFDQIVPERMSQMKEAILNRNFDQFAELTMKDSNQFHAICLDTFPPIFYLNDTSRAIIQLITDFNSTPLQGWPGKYKAAYTYVLFYLMDRGLFMML